MTSTPLDAVPRRAVVLGLGLGLSGCAAAVPGSPSSPSRSPAAASSVTSRAPTRLQLVVSPHPDDEMEAWSQVDPSPDVHTVWLTMTRGEATAHCGPQTLAAELDVAAGEIAPPAPRGPGTRSCEDARMAAWTTFLTLAHGRGEPAGRGDHGSGAAASVGERAGGRAGPGAPRRLDLPDRPAASGLPAAPVATRGGRASPGALVWAGDRQSMVAVDAGDGEVTVAEVGWAVRAVLAQRGALLPDLPLERVVSAAYVGAPPDATYQHPDHRAVQEALLDPALTAALAPLRGTYVVTGAHDPRANLTGAIPPDEYERLMGLGPQVAGDHGATVRREGLMQRVYGWLAFPGGFWPPTERPVDDAAGDPLIMARVQSFVHLPGSAR